MSTHRPSAPSVSHSEHALQMAAAMRDATPTGEVHRIQVTILLTAALKVCTAQHAVSTCCCLVQA